MKRIHFAVLTGVLLVSCYAVPSQAQSLLGSVTDTVDELLGDDNTTNTVETVTNTVEEALSGGDTTSTIETVTNTVEEVLGGSTTSSTTETVTNTVDTLLGSTTSTVNNIGGGGGLLGTSGTNGTNGTNGASANGPIFLSNSSGGNSGASGPNCIGTSAPVLARLVQSTRPDASWGRVSNVEIKPVAVCAAEARWLKQQLQDSLRGQQMYAAISSDNLIAASLDRTRFNASNVFAVQKNGNRLTVFVH